MNLIHYWPLKETISQQRPGVTLFFCLRRYYGMSNLTADIVHGFACFDPQVLASMAMEQVTFCFGALFQSFCLRGWVQRFSESDYRDEYMKFLDYFRASFPQLKDQPGQIKDVVNFLLISRPYVIVRIYFTCSDLAAFA